VTQVGLLWKKRKSLWLSERLLEEEEGDDDDDDDTVVSSGKIYLAVWWSGSGCVLGGARGWQGI
jgi:hypothetical protein